MTLHSTALHSLRSARPLPHLEGFAGPTQSAPSCSACPVRSTGVCGAFCEGDDPDMMASLSRRIHLPAKSILMDEGAPADYAYTLVSGTVLLSKLLADGRRQVIGFAVAGDFLGLSMREFNNMSAVALTPVEVCRAQLSHVRDVAARSPRFLRRLHEMMATELEAAQGHMMLLGRRSAEEKIVCFLLGLRSRVGRQNGLSPRVDLPMTRLDMADYLGVTLETVSRTLSKLARNRLIVIVPDGVRLLDIGKLEAVYMPQS